MLWKFRFCRFCTKISAPRRFYNKSYGIFNKIYSFLRKFLSFQQCLRLWCWIKAKKSQKRSVFFLVLCHFFACEAKFQKMILQIFRRFLAARHLIETRLGIMTIAYTLKQCIFFRDFWDPSFKSVKICVGWNIGIWKYLKNGFEG